MAWNMQISALRAALALLLTAGAGAAAQPAAPGTVSVDCVRTDIRRVIAQIQEQTPQRIVVEDAARLRGDVTASLRGVSPLTALRAVAQSAGATVTVGPDGTFLVRTAIPPPKAAAPAPVPAKPVPPAVAGPANPFDRLPTEDAADILKQIHRIYVMEGDNSLLVEVPNNPPAATGAVQPTP